MSEKFKNKEFTFQSNLPDSPFYGIRMDGKAFHTFTKQFDKPYSTKFMNAMNNAGLVAAKNVASETKLFYVQSDEITLILKNNNNGQFSYSGRIDKLVSLSSSAATAGFLSECPDVDGLPIFDSRIFALDSKDEVIEYLDWRRLDARKNAITMTAEYVYGGKALHKKTTTERLEMLNGTEFENNIPYDFYFGRFGHIVKKEETVEVPNRGSFNVERNVWTMSSAFKDTTRDLVAEI